MHLFFYHKLPSFAAYSPRCEVHRDIKTLDFPKNFTEQNDLHPKLRKSYLIYINASSTSSGSSTVLGSTSIGYSVP